MKTELMLKQMEQAYEKPVSEWTNEDMDKFLLGLEVTSSNTAQTYVHIIRQVHKHACVEVGKEYVELQPMRSLIDYINYQKLRSVTITKQEFKQIREELKYVDVSRSIEGNFRDVALFELAWCGLTSKEIKFLQRSDIKVVETGLSVEIHKVVKNNNGEEVVTDELVRTIIIDDSQIVEDILKAVKEQTYFKIRYYTDKTLIDELYYAESPYLIRGIDNGNTIEGKPINHIGMLIYKQLKKVIVPDSKIDFEHLSVEDIRRSMLIDMLDRSEVNIATLKAFLNKKQQNDLQWLKPVAMRLKEMIQQLF
ncbi:MAG: hypothetical protein WA131_12970 [Desulfitobacteriaceae bacterium]